MKAGKRKQVHVQIFEKAANLWPYLPRIIGFVVLAIFVLQRVLNLGPTLDGQLIAELHTAVSALNHGFHLQDKIVKIRPSFTILLCF